MDIIEGFGFAYSSDEKAPKLKLRNTLKAMTHEWWAPGKVVYLKQAPIGEKGKWIEGKFNEITKDEYDAELEATLAQVREFVAGKTQIRIDWSYNHTRDDGFSKLVLEEIAKSDSVKEVDLSFSGPDDVTAHLDALKDMPIKKLSVAGNHISSATKLVEALALFKSTLTDIAIFECSLGKNLVAVLKGLQGFEALQNVSLHGNEPNYSDHHTQQNAISAFNKNVAAALKEMPGIKVNISKEIAELAGAEKIVKSLCYKIPAAAGEGNVHEAMDGLALTDNAGAPAEAAVEALGGNAAGALDSEGDLT